MKNFYFPKILSLWSLTLLFVVGCAIKDKPSIAAYYRDDRIIVDYFYLGLNYYKQGEYDLAVTEFSRALLVNPDFAMAYYNRAVAYSQKGQFNKAISDYNKAIEADPKFAEAFYNRGTIFTEQGQIELDPELAEAFYNRGNINTEQDQHDKALSDYTKAIKMNPKFADAYYNRGSIYYGKGHYGLAISDYSKAIEINPKNAMAYKNRGHAYREKGLYKEAISDFTKTIEINPDDGHAYNEKAWILATCSDPSYRDGDKAVELAQKAVDISPKPVYLDTLSAAYAEAGKFENAITTQEQVVAKIKKTSADKNLVNGFTERLKYYKAHRPWRVIR